MSVLSSPPAAPPPAAPVARMKRHRVWVVYGILFVIVAGHLFEVATQREHWPFSHYPMWSRPSTSWDMNREFLRGVTVEPTPREVPLTPDQLYPMHYQLTVVNMQHAAAAAGRMEKALAEAGRLKAAGDEGWKASQKAADKHRAEAERIVGGILEHYNNRRKAGHHDGPELKELRLYQVTWRMDRNAVQETRKNPIKTSLRYPVLTDEQRASAIPPVSPQLVSEFGDDYSDE